MRAAMVIYGPAKGEKKAPLFWRGLQGVKKVDTLSSKAHFIQAFDELTEV